MRALFGACLGLLIAVALTIAAHADGISQIGGKYTKAASGAGSSGDPWVPEVAITALGSPLQAGGTVAAPLTTLITNPTSVLTRPGAGDVNPYAQNDLLASSTTAGSVVVPSFAIANSAGGASIQRLRLTTNKASGWDATTFTVRLWSTAPTYTNGDNGAYAVATGAAGFLGAFNVTLAQFADGASGNMQPLVGNAVWVKLASGSAVYWDLQYTGSAALTPASAQTFTLTAEVVN